MNDYLNSKMKEKIYLNLNFLCNDYFKKYILELEMSLVKKDYNEDYRYTNNDYQYFLNQIKSKIKNNKNSLYLRDIQTPFMQLDLEIDANKLSKEFKSYSCTFQKKFNYFYNECIASIKLIDIFKYYVPSVYSQFIFDKYKYRNIKINNGKIINNKKGFYKINKKTRNILVNINLLSNCIFNIKNIHFYDKVYLIYFLIDYYQNIFESEKLKIDYSFHKRLENILNKFSNLEKQLNILKQEDVILFLKDKYKSKVDNFLLKYHQCLNDLADIYNEFYKNYSNNNDINMNATMKKIDELIILENSI